VSLPLVGAAAVVSAVPMTASSPAQARGSIIGVSRGRRSGATRRYVTSPRRRAQIQLRRLVGASFRLLKHYVIVGFSEFSESVTRASAESPQNRSETGEAPPAKASESQRNAEFAEVTELVKSDTQRDRARAREQNGDTEPRRAHMPWMSQRSHGELSILDMNF
jgi:hypothetical protein